MNFKIDTWRMVLVVVAVGLIFLGNDNMPKEAVADIEGQPCYNNTDCPCWGLYNTTMFPENTLSEGNDTAFGIGVGRCIGAEPGIQGTCDVTYCIDVQPVGTWLRDHPWTHLRENPFQLLAALAILGLAIFFPKS